MSEEAKAGPELRWEAKRWVAGPPTYEAGEGKHFYSIVAMTGTRVWGLCYFGPFGTYEPNIEVGTVAECKAAAERDLEERRG